MPETKIWGIHGGATGDADALFLQHDVIVVENKNGKQKWGRI